MTKQIIETPKGERLVVIPEAEYEALIEAIEDAEDLAAVAEIEAKRARGEEEETVPAEFVGRMLAGESLIRLWREHRGLSAKELAEKAGIAQAYLSQLETGKREGPVGTLKKLAEVLKVTIDDLTR